MMKVKATVWKTTVIRAGSKLPQVWQEQQHPKSPLSHAVWLLFLSVTALVIVSNRLSLFFSKIRVVAVPSSESMTHAVTRLVSSRSLLPPVLSESNFSLVGASCHERHVSDYGWPLGNVLTHLTE